MLVCRREDEKRGSMRDAAAAAGNSIKTTGFIREGVERGYGGGGGGIIYVRKEGGKDNNFQQE